MIIKHIILGVVATIIVAALFYWIDREVMHILVYVGMWAFSTFFAWLIEN